jgi:hypothetical protein
LVGYKVSTKQLSEFSPSEKKWFQQDISQNQTKMYVKEFMVDHINAWISFVFKTKASKDINFAGPLRLLKLGGLSLITIDGANFKLKR